MVTLENTELFTLFTCEVITWPVSYKTSYWIVRNGSMRKILNYRIYLRLQVEVEFLVSRFGGFGDKK